MNDTVVFWLLLVPAILAAWSMPYDVDQLLTAVGRNFLVKTFQIYGILLILAGLIILGFSIPDNSDVGSILHHWKSISVVGFYWVLAGKYFFTAHWIRTRLAPSVGHRSPYPA